MRRNKRDVSVGDVAILPEHLGCCFAAFGIEKRDLDLLKCGFTMS